MKWTRSLVNLLKPQFIGRSALVAARSAGIPKRIVGVAIEWTDVEALYQAVGLPPLGVATASRRGRAGVCRQPPGRTHDLIHLVSRAETNDRESPPSKHHLPVSDRGSKWSTPLTWSGIACGPRWSRCRFSTRGGRTALQPV
jgi:hypothetical protein